MLKGRSALVTGSLDGIGLHVAKALAAEGCGIVLNGLGDPEIGEARAAELAAAHGVDAFYHAADLRDRSQIRDMAAAASARFGAVDILVNNAVVRHFAPVEEFPDDRWDEALAVNLTAAFLLTKLLLPKMKERRFGRIVNMSSIAAVSAITKRIDYVTTKAALLGMTRVVALENVKHNVTCNALLPGSVLTPYSDARIQAIMAARGVGREEATSDFLSGRQAAGRFVDPAGIGALVVFLCGAAAGDITGAALPVDIGFTAGWPLE